MSARLLAFSTRSYLSWEPQPIYFACNFFDVKFFLSLNWSSAFHLLECLPLAMVKSKMTPRVQQPTITKMWEVSARQTAAAAAHIREGIGISYQYKDPNSTTPHQWCELHSGAAVVELERLRTHDSDRVYYNRAGIARIATLSKNGIWEYAVLPGSGRSGTEDTEAPRTRIRWVKGAPAPYREAVAVRGKGFVDDALCKCVEHIANACLNNNWCRGTKRKGGATDAGLGESGVHSLRVSELNKRFFHGTDSYMELIGAECALDSDGSTKGTIYLYAAWDIDQPILTFDVNPEGQIVYQLDM